MSCLFNSLSKYILDLNVNGAVVRNDICNFLATNPVLITPDIKAEEVIKDECGMDLEMYVSNMRDSNTFGGAIEINAFTKIYKLNVLVKSLPNKKNIEFIENLEYMWAVLEWGGNHYEAVDKQ